MSANKRNISRADDLVAFLQSQPGPLPLIVCFNEDEEQQVVSASYENNRIVLGIASIGPNRIAELEKDVEELEDEVDDLELKLKRIEDIIND